ncbi:unnamed protein product [Ceutorhynchus assimilis]|uniref:Uncharacterized protein n=1 Tax=Ceutorhynchus assimilis TaxID=467358 RepID=A0A9N9N0D0_9CUCU|nr:unnamed protein product [Ceutorhynchus assimilis]
MANGTIVLNRTRVSDMSDIKNITMYLTSYRNTIFRDISFYVYGIVLKLIPCILLVLLSTLLVIELFKAKQRRKLLHAHSNETKLLKKKTNQKHVDKEKQFNRTTKMLLAVLLLFLMAEFPQAMMGLLLHILGEKFSEECYGPLDKHVNKKYVLELVARFRETGSVLGKKHVRPAVVNNEVMQVAVLGQLHARPGMSVRQLASATGLSKRVFTEF